MNRGAASARSSCSNRAVSPHAPSRRAWRICLANLSDAPSGFARGWNRRISRDTRIEVVTEGILTRWLQSDPALEGVAVVIFDEYHERSLNADLGLALCLDAQGALREDLKLLVMSATLDGAAVAKLLGEAPIVAARRTRLRRRDSLA